MTLPRATALFGIVAVVALVASAPGIGALADGTPDATDPPGSIDFIGRNLMATARGTFHRWQITSAQIDRARPEQSAVTIEIDVASLDTGIGRRDDHLRNEDFFFVEQYPVARVRAHSPARAGERDGRDLYSVKLDLDLHGIAKTVAATVSVSQADPGAGPIDVEGEVVLDRLDFEIGDPPSRFNPFSIRREVPVSFRATLEGGPTP